MTDENLHRVKTIAALYMALGRKVEDEEVGVIARATLRIPLVWLSQAVDYLAQSWTMQRRPGVPEIRREASRLAGFLPVYNAWCDSPDPIPLWWPVETPVPPSLAQSWNQRPPDVLIESGAAVVVPLLPPRSDPKQAHMPDRMSTRPMEPIQSGLWGWR